MLTFVEDKTRYSEVNFLQQKSDAPPLIKVFCEKVNNPTQTYARSFRTDKGVEFIYVDREAYFKEEGIKYQHTGAYAHESNGVAERYTQTLSAMVRPALE